MNRKPINNNELDKIFRDSIENMETEPSESFWTKASEENLFKNSLVQKKTANRWKLVAATLAIALIGLSGYTVYIQKQVSILNKKVSSIAIENNVKPANINSVASANTIPITNNVLSSQKAKASNNESTNVKPKNSITLNKAVTKSGYSTVGASLNRNKTIAPTLNTITEQIADNNTNSYSNSVETATNNSTEMSSISAEKIALIDPMANISSPGNINLPADYVNPASHKNWLSKFSVSLFFEPYISDELFENDDADNVTVNNSVVSSEEEVNPFAIGARVEYNICSHFSFVTGCNFYNFNVSFQPTTIYAAKQSDGDIGYSFQTSVGSVNCPYGTSNLNVGDAMIIKGTYATDYINVPLLLKYSLQLGSHWSIYAIGGAEINFVAYRKVDMYWHDMKWNEGEAKEGVSNASNTYYSIYFAPGVSYKLMKNISIFAEPSLQGPPTLFSKKGMVAGAGVYDGVGVGVTCKL